MNKVIEPYQVYNIIEASALLDVNSQTLTDYCREGKLTCTKIGEWKILGQNIINFLQKPQSPVETSLEVLLRHATENLNKDSQLPPIKSQNTEKNSIQALFEAAAQVAKNKNPLETTLPPIK